MKKIPLSYHTLIAITALFLCLFCNSYFFTLISPKLSLFKLFLVSLLLFALLGLALEILCIRWSAKFVIGFILLVSASFSYSINSLGTGITPDLIYSILSANPREVKETLNLSLLYPLVLIFILPCIALFFISLSPASSPIRGLLSKIFAMVFYLVLSLSLWFWWGGGGLEEM